ncbi:hypothetical protein [Pseudonocardia parietis]|uniref:DUF3099 family protein n=1 Tax=Pseudonocardia parietis TaxID=570936 RepID=A0ABS4W6X1_9PSEU|nr:hypothetical protein [Pseudonocardia parietis]MBP2371955.1 hypothetical protein [Pseudonocardia parietis]
MGVLLRAVLRTGRALGAAVAVLGVVLGGVVLADWVGRTYDVVWAVVALMALPLAGAGMVVHDQWVASRRAGRVSPAESPATMSSVSSVGSVERR